MKGVLLVLVCLLVGNKTNAQDGTLYYYDNDSNNRAIINGDTQYVQQAYSQKMRALFGSNSSFVYRGIDYRDRPHFKGSVAQYLMENLEYPKDALKDGIEEKVILTFTVDKNGVISNIKTLGKYYPSLEKEAIRLVERMPKWLPALDIATKEPIESQGGIAIPFELY